MPSVGSEACEGAPSVHERLGGVTAYDTRAPAVLARLGFPGGNGSSHSRGASHRTNGQSEESGLRHHRVTQTTSQSGLRRTSWASTVALRVRRIWPCRFHRCLAGGSMFVHFGRLFLRCSTPPVAKSMMSELICPSRAQRVWLAVAWRDIHAVANTVYPAAVRHRFVRDVDGTTAQQSKR